MPVTPMPPTSERYSACNNPEPMIPLPGSHPDRAGPHTGRQLAANRCGPSSFLTAKAIAAAALPVPAARITDPETAVAGLPTAADQYQFIQQRLAAWYEATHTKPEEGS